MKRVPLFLCGLLAFGGASAPAVADESSTREISLRPTHEELLAKQSAHREKVKAREVNIIPPGELKKRDKRSMGDIVARSTVLSSGRNWTIVPKGSVLHVPSFLAGRVDGEKTGPFVSWNTFQTQNRGWIHLQNVKMNQARGKAKMPEGAAEAYPQIGRVVVAVCHGGPISVKKFEEEKPADDEAATAAAQTR